jgi:formylmethanofuran dehydrogenase subunit E
MTIPDNADLYDMYDREQERLSRHDKEVVTECDLCGKEIYEDEDYMYIEPWDKCLCEDCATVKLDKMWRTA